VIALLTPYHKINRNVFRQMLMSVSAQTCKDFVAYFWRDGVERSDEIDKFNDLRFVHIGSDMNLGEGGARNKLIEAAVSDGAKWFVTADPDDLLMPRRMEAFAHVCKNAEDDVACITNASFFYKFVNKFDAASARSMMSVLNGSRDGINKAGMPKSSVLGRWTHHAGGTQPVAAWRCIDPVTEIRHIDAKFGGDWVWTCSVAVNLIANQQKTDWFEGEDSTAYVYMAPSMRVSMDRYKGHPSVFSDWKARNKKIWDFLSLKDKRIKPQYPIGVRP